MPGYQTNSECDFLRTYFTRHSCCHAVLILLRRVGTYYVKVADTGRDRTWHDVSYDHRDHLATNKHTK